MIFLRKPNRVRRWERSVESFIRSLEMADRVDVLTEEGLRSIQSLHDAIIEAEQEILRVVALHKKRYYKFKRIKSLIGNLSEKGKFLGYNKVLDCSLDSKGEYVFRRGNSDIVFPSGTQMIHVLRFFEEILNDRLGGDYSLDRDPYRGIECPDIINQKGCYFPHPQIHSKRYTSYSSKLAIIHFCSSRFSYLYLLSLYEMICNLLDLYELSLGVWVIMHCSDLESDDIYCFGQKDLADHHYVEFQKSIRIVPTTTHFLMKGLEKPYAAFRESHIYSCASDRMKLLAHAQNNGFYDAGMRKIRYRIHNPLLLRAYFYISIPILQVGYFFQDLWLYVINDLPELFSKIKNSLSGET